MIPKNVYTGLFVALCLTLSGLILGRQMVAHPAPPPDSAADGRSTEGRDGGGGFRGRREFHIADTATRWAVLGSIQGQLDALRRGDASRSASYQSREMRRRFTRPADFLGMINAQYPEFAHSRSASFGPVWEDAGQWHAGTLVTVIGRNGRQARGFYRMAREGGVYRVEGVRMRP
jgi:hypothetical protein